MLKGIKRRERERRLTIGVELCVGPGLGGSWMGEEELLVSVGWYAIGAGGSAAVGGVVDIGVGPVADAS